MFHLLSLLFQLIPHGSDLAGEVVVLLLLVLQLGELLRALKGVEEEGSEEEISNIDHKQGQPTPQSHPRSDQLMLLNSVYGHSILTFNSITLTLLSPE